jgi:hypothetical protein
MTTTYITSEEFKAQLIEALKPHRISYYRFLRMNIDDAPNYEVRDMHLMGHNIMLDYEKRLGNIVMRAKDFDSHFKHACVRAYPTVSKIPTEQCCDVEKTEINEGFERLLDTDWFQVVARSKYDDDRSDSSLTAAHLAKKVN